MSEKIRPHHLERKAILYVRQSSAYQVPTIWRARSCSTRCRSTLQQLGWREIEVIDDDLGRSAAGTVRSRRFRAYGGRGVSWAK